MKPQPLTDAEFERLTAVLERFGDKRSMNLEQLDGLLAALICGPELVPPSEYLPVIWEDDMVLEDTFGAQPVLQDFLSLIMRYGMSLPIRCNQVSSCISRRHIHPPSGASRVFHGSIQDRVRSWSVSLSWSSCAARGQYFEATNGFRAGVASMLKSSMLSLPMERTLHRCCDCAMQFARLCWRVAGNRIWGSW